MSRRSLKKATLIIAVVAVAVAGYWAYDRASTVFPNLIGPTRSTSVMEATPTPSSAYGACTNIAAAIYLTAKDSPWLGLAHGLKSIGVPFCVTNDIAVAVQQSVIIGYPALNGVTLSEAQQFSLERHVRDGGTLIGFAAEGTKMGRVFGFGTATGNRARAALSFADSPWTHDFLSDAKEARIRIGDRNNAETMQGSIGYADTLAAPLATFEDGSAAITQHRPGRGYAFAFGFDVGHFTLRAQNGRNDELSKNYSNSYEPTVDVFLRLLKSMYQTGEPNAVTLYTVPNNQPMAVLVTHDIDYARSMVNAVKYAEFEQSQGIAATYFIQTKYVQDFNDEIFFNPDSVQYLRRLENLGMEIASHSVAHSRVFASLEKGSGGEQYPQYRPFVKNQTKTTGASLLGELRVSKFLLDNFSAHKVETFRPGYLSNPPTLNEALVATGYRFSSSSSANSLLTHLPFRAMYARGYHAELPLYEFPVTIEDEALPKLGDRLASAIDVADRVSRYGGTVNILIHPDILDHKLAFLEGFVGATKKRAWYGSVREYGNWWRARDSVRLEIVGDSRKRGSRPLSLSSTRTLSISTAEPISKLTVEVPAAWRLQSAAGATQKGNRVILDTVTSEQVLTFTTAR